MPIATDPPASASGLLTSQVYDLSLPGAICLPAFFPNSYIASRRRLLLEWRGKSVPIRPFLVQGEEPDVNIQRVGVAGGGLMGSGIAEVCARAGYQVVVREISDELAARSRERVRASMQRAVDRGKAISSDMDGALSRLSTTTALADLAGCQLIIEAVVEVMAEKKRLFAELDAICPGETIFASNTSSLSITEMAASTQRPANFAGLHFFSPVPAMPLAEVVRGLGSSSDTIDTLRQFAESLGKTPIVAQDTPGFIVNRLLIPYLLDAVRCYEAGLATREDIDNGVKLGLSHPMGPLALLDFIGLDVTCNIADILFDAYREARFAPPPLLRRMVQAGRLGRKTGRGFYEYKER